MKQLSRLNIVIIFTVFQFLPVYFYPQVKNLNINNYNVAEGLSQNQVQSIIQDSKGFIWIGTQNGLNRFDGYNFKVYRHNPQNLNSLSDYPVHCITEDPDGFLWIGTRDGLNRFDPRTEKFVHFHHDPEDETSISSNVIWSVLIDKLKNIWIATRSGLNKYLPEKTLLKDIISAAILPILHKQILHLLQKTIKVIFGYQPPVD
jgi:ligand-binding sensor domain-containing protein